MHLLLSGSSGLVGSALRLALVSKGHRVKTLVRHPPQNPSEIFWDPLHAGPSPAALEGIETVIHLAGESIASGRWTAARKNAIRDSRVLGTHYLVESLIRMPVPPQALLTASAIGFYGHRGDEWLRECSPPGIGFLPELCQDWEAATASAREKNIRVVALRFGIILSPHGGALAKMLFPFKLGVGGKLGSGQQYMSWMALDDVVGALLFTAFHATLQGPVNTVAPEPVTNANFTQILGRVLSRPTVFPMPAPAARLAFGEMADALLLASARVEPTVLKSAGYAFQYPDLEGALRHLLKK
jgi:uncharacterized protein (TIGR01777 family)